jgi:hypothetical protein
MFWCLAAAVALIVPSALAAKSEQGGTKKRQRAKAERITVVGVVQVTKGEDNKVKAVTITTEDDEAAEKQASNYKVYLNARGKQLGEKMEGKKVEAKGVLMKRKDRKTQEEVTWLRLGSFKETKGDAEKPKKKAEKDDEGGDDIDG